MSALASRFPAHDRDTLRPPQAPGLGRGFAFAVVAHLVLVLALSAGVQWRTRTLPTYEAELWAAVPQAAAPREQLPPEDPPEPKVQPKPEPKPPEPDPRELQAQRDAEIAIAKAEKKKKELEAKRLAELEAERKKAEERAKQELAKKEQAKKDEKQRQAEAAAKEAKDAKQAEAKREALRQENLRRIQGMAGASGGPGATGTALQSAGPSASYGGRIKARIRPNIIYADSPSGNPVAEVEVRVAPDGTIIGRKIIKASGDAEWDKAVLRAIDKTETLPRDVDGRVPSLLVISFQPRE